MLIPSAVVLGLLTFVLLIFPLVSARENYSSFTGHLEEKSNYYWWVVSGFLSIGSLHYLFICEYLNSIDLDIAWWFLLQLVFLTSSILLFAVIPYRYSSHPFLHQVFAHLHVAMIAAGQFLLGINFLLNNQASLGLIALLLGAVLGLGELAILSRVKTPFYTTLFHLLMLYPWILFVIISSL